MEAYPVMPSILLPGPLSRNRAGVGAAQPGYFPNRKYSVEDMLSSARQQHGVLLIHGQTWPVPFGLSMAGRGVRVSIAQQRRPSASPARPRTAAVPTVAFVIGTFDLWGGVLENTPGAVALG